MSLALSFASVPSSTQGKVSAMARRSIGFVLYRPYYPNNPMHFTSLEAAARQWEDGPGVAELREVVQLRTKDYDRAVKARNKDNS